MTDAEPEEPDMPTKKLQQAVYPKAFLNMARDYADAANELFMIAEARPKIQGRHLPLSSPLYLLYSHAAELALKAFLQAKNVPTPKTHELAKLYEESRDLGLVIGPKDRFQIGNIVSFLDSGNKKQGFRYFNLESCTVANLSWVREGIPELIRAVEPHVQAHIDIGPRGAKMTAIFSKPTLKPGGRPKPDGA
jgi:HEPN domain